MVAALQNLITGDVHPLDGQTRILVGRHKEAQVPLRDPACSRRQFQIECANDVFTLIPLSEVSPTFCDGRRVEGPTPLRFHAVIRAGASSFRLIPNRMRPVLADRPTIVGLANDDLEETELPTFVLDRELILGRDPAQASAVLPHVLVSRRHARIRRHGGDAIIADLGSANGTFINGQRLIVDSLIRAGDRVNIGPYELNFTGTVLRSRSTVEQPLLQARNLVRTVRNRLGGARLTLVNDVSLKVRAGEFLVILGPSGCGKTTLLTMLSGQVPPSSGDVLCSGRNLYAGEHGACANFAVVPQQNLLPEMLTVDQAVRFTARLRLPPDTSAAELNRTIDRTLGSVGLTSQRFQPIKRLSGGQKRRVALANELVADPDVIFLDEATAGLDEQADRTLMLLFRQIAESGKSIIAVTHNLAAVPDACHRVIVLHRGGRLAFNGTPADAQRHFRLERLGDVYEQLDEAELPTIATTTGQLNDTPAVAATFRLAKVWSWPRFVHQFPILISRNITQLRADPRALVVQLCQCLLVGALLIAVFGDVNRSRSPNPLKVIALDSHHVMFLLTIASFWFGCNNAVKELVRERDWFLRERHVSLDTIAYIASKAAVLGLLSILQAAMLCRLTWWGCHLPADPTSTLTLLTGLALVGVAWGLAISAWAASESVAVALLPLVLIPQLILSDVFRPLEGFTKTMAQYLSAPNWGFLGFGSALNENLRSMIASSASLRSAGIALMLQMMGLITLTWLGLQRTKR